MSHDSTRSQHDNDQRRDAARRPVCPACGGRVVEIHGKLVCSRCHRICETCCEGGREEEY